MSRKTACVCSAILILTSCLALTTTDDVRAWEGVNDDGDNFVRVVGCSFGENPLHLGSQNVTMSIDVYNLRRSDGVLTNGDERLYNVTVRIVGILDDNGKDLPVSDWPIEWDVDRITNNGDGYVIGYVGESSINPRTISGFQFDVSPDAKPGKYNISVKIHYKYVISYNNTTGEIKWSSEKSEVEISISFEIDTNVIIGSLQAFDEHKNPMPLYSNNRFQIVGLPITTKVGTLKNVRVTLIIPSNSKTDMSISGGCSPMCQIREVKNTAYAYFRVDLEARAGPGKFSNESPEVFVTVTYIRAYNWNGDEMNVVVSEKNRPVTVVIDYTPVINISDISPKTISQGTTSCELAVTLKNIGNVDAIEIEITMDAGKYIWTGEKYYDDNGDLHWKDEKVKLDSLATDYEKTVIFKIYIKKDAPPGTYRLFFQYTAYYSNDGSTGETSGIYSFTDSMNEILFKKPLFADIEITDDTPNLEIKVKDEIVNPNGGKKGSLSITVENRENTDYEDVTFKLIGYNETPIIMGKNYVIMSKNVAVFRSNSEIGFTVDLEINSNGSFGYANLRFEFEGIEVVTRERYKFKTNLTIYINPPAPEIIMIANGTLYVKDGVQDVPIEIYNMNTIDLINIRCKIQSNDSYMKIDKTQTEFFIGHLPPYNLKILHLRIYTSQNMSEGSYNITSIITCSYSTGDVFTLRKNISLYVRKEPISIKIVSVQSEKNVLSEGEITSINVTIMNSGGSSTLPVKVMLYPLETGLKLIGESEGNTVYEKYPIVFESNVQILNFVNTSETANISFNISSIDSVSGTYHLVVIVEYERDGEKIYEWIPVSISTKARDKKGLVESSQNSSELQIALAVTLTILIFLLASLIVIHYFPKAKIKKKRMNYEDLTPLEPEVYDMRTPGGSQSMPQFQMTPPQPPHHPEDLPPPPPHPQGDVPAPASQPQPSQMEPQHTPPPTLMPPPPPPIPPMPESTLHIKDEKKEEIPVAETKLLDEKKKPSPLDGIDMKEEKEVKYTAPPKKPPKYSGKPTPKRFCPHCGEKVKLRFVKCPYCGGDLPPRK